MSDDALTAAMGGSILYPCVSPLGKIPDAGPIADTISQTTELSGTWVSAGEMSLSASEMSNLPTHDSRPIICMDEEQNDQVYDSDGQIGPFFDAV